MVIDKLFIVNALLLAALVAGASYLQTVYGTGPQQGVQSVSVAATTTAATATAGTSSGWQVSTATTPAHTTATPAATPVAPKPAAPAPKPSIRRVYNDDEGGDN